MNATLAVETTKHRQYLSRVDAGQRLAKALERYRNTEVVVLGLPRGGVVLAAVVARYLHSPLGVVLVRKIGHPSYPEYAIGAVVEGEEPIYHQHQEIFHDQRLSADVVSARRLLDRRLKIYYGDHFNRPEVMHKTCILVDDGIATGMTMLASAMALRRQGAFKIVVAVPIASNDGLDMLSPLVDYIVVLNERDEFRGSVGLHYLNFEPVTDEDVVRLLREVNHEEQV